MESKPSSSKEAPPWVMPHPIPLSHYPPQTQPVSTLTPEEKEFKKLLEKEYGQPVNDINVPRILKLNKDFHNLIKTRGPMA